MTEQHRGALADVEVGRVDVHLGRLREALHAVLAVHAREPGPERRGTRRPEQPVALVHAPRGRAARSRAQRSAASGRYSVEPKASSAMKICGRLGVVGAPELLRPHALVRLPALRQPCQRDGAGDRGLAHLGRTTDDREGRGAPGRRPSRGRRGSVTKTRASSCAASTSRVERRTTSSSASPSRWRTPSTNGTRRRTVGRRRGWPQGAGRRAPRRARSRARRRSGRRARRSGRRSRTGRCRRRTRAGGRGR